MKKFEAVPERLTAAEFEGFLHLLYCQFPSLREWLKAFSPDPNKTQQIWYRTVRHCDLSELKSVLAQWAELNDNPLKAYSRDAVAQLLRAAVAENRRLYAAIQNRVTANELRGGYLSAKATSKSTNMLASYAAARVLRQDVDAGKIDPSEAESRIRELVDSVR